VGTVYLPVGLGNQGRVTRCEVAALGIADSGRGERDRADCLPVRRIPSVEHYLAVIKARDDQDGSYRRGNYEHE
jgi:hypothetical protein